MAQHDNIMVDILIDGKPQPIYDDPDPESNNKAKGKNFYVEAIDDARFAVRITLGSGFQLFDADGVDLHVRLDGGRDWCHYFDLSKTTSNRSRTVEARPNYDATAREWVREAFSFGKLQLLESSEMQEAPAQLQSLGEISVGVERVTVRTLREPKPVKVLEEKAVTQVSEKLLKGKAIENALKPIKTGSMEAPMETRDYRPLAWPNGRKIELNILYRSRKALQSLGCIPRTPSPEPTLGHDEEVRALRARLALLERGSRIKSETPGSVIDLTSTEASGRARMKRERDGDINNQHRKRSRGLGVEVVDLTDD